jgi:hypothetical protein
MQSHRGTRVSERGAPYVASRMLVKREKRRIVVGGKSKRNQRIAHWLYGLTMLLCSVLDFLLTPPNVSCHLQVCSCKCFSRKVLYSRCPSIYSSRAFFSPARAVRLPACAVYVRDPTAHYFPTVHYFPRGFTCVSAS